MDILEVWNFVTTDVSLHQIFQVIVALCLLLFSCGLFLRQKGAGTWLPCSDLAPAKRACEIWFLAYGVFWISCFGVIIATRIYDTWGQGEYMVVLGGLMSPLLLQPLFYPRLTCDEGKALLDRYSFKANLWLFIFGFIGNYWYTHYFYNVLKASYSMKSWDLNGVPIPMYFATHFYFCFYHTLSNMALRKVATRYCADSVRWFFSAVLIATLSYITAFMEALTISGYSCYNFADRHMAWVYGSWFYGIYFLVSFPMFLRIDEPRMAEPDTAAPATPATPATTLQHLQHLPPSGGAAPLSSSPTPATPATLATLSPPPTKSFSAFETSVESLASGMAVLLLLDFVRVALGVDLNILLNRPCKLDYSLTCAPFSGQQC